MSKRSEEAALKAYPVHIIEHQKVMGGVIKIDTNTNPRFFFTEGYELAERDLEETMERDALKCYEQGYKQAEKELGWHSVEESLPEIDKEVIVLADRLNLGSLFAIAIGHIVDKEKAVDYNGWNISGVKYWMPMPKIPEEK